jgi:hypothetical protein
MRERKMLMTSFHPFRSELAKKRYLAYYNRREQEWPIRHEENQINTSVGELNIIQLGKIYREGQSRVLIGAEETLAVRYILLLKMLIIIGV